jgi:predicted transglutaminase-like cysteine proteinase
MHRLILFHVTLWLSLFFMQVLNVQASVPQFRIFGSSEVVSTNLTPFPKWTSVLQRDVKHRQTMVKICAMTKDEACPLQAWQSIVNTAHGQPMRDMLDVVNSRINKITYVTDIVNWGLDDYWETPYEFFSRDGDCEDYAIAKYLTLKALGVPIDAMRVVVLQDNNLNLLHSVLAVEDKGNIYILDNQISQVVRDKDIHHYMPIYSINEQGWWRHLP